VTNLASPRYIIAGKIVPVAITVGLIYTAMRKSLLKGTANFLVDGFPRSLENWAGWEEVVGDKATVQFMLFFECPLPVLEQRIMGRAQYSGRKDDNLESLRQRFETYKTETMPIVDVFRAKDLVRQIDTSQGRTDVYEEVKALLLPTTAADLAAAPLVDRSQILLGLKPWPKRK